MFFVACGILLCLILRYFVFVFAHIIPDQDLFCNNFVIKVCQLALTYGRRPDIVDNFEYNVDNYRIFVKNMLCFVDNFR